MTFAIITTAAKEFAAEKLRDTFVDGTAKHYLFVGKTLPWANDASPDDPVDAVGQDWEARRDMLALKRIQSTDVSMGIVNSAWKSGQWYDMYRHDYRGATAGVNLTSGAATLPASLWDTNFYAITEDYNIYKCIYNGGGAQSTIKPIGTSTAQFATADGYIWKYMGTIPQTAISKFLNSAYVPVKYVGVNPGFGDSYYNQYLVEQAAVSGSIDFIKVDLQGSGYTASSTTIPVTITGDGVGATAQATANSQGRITSITITSGGGGYTWANVSIGGTGTGAATTAIISPRGGHGSNIQKELGAHFLILDITLSYDEGTGDFPVGNSFRRVGIIRDPLLYGTTTVATSTTYNANRLLTLSPVTGAFVANETITGSTSSATGVVVSYNAATKTVRYYQTSSNSGTFAVSETVLGSTSGATGAISTKIDPEVDAFTGELMYLEHRSPVARASDQIEDIKVVIEA